MSEPTVSRSEQWRHRAKRLTQRARATLPFASGVLAALVALLIYHAFAPVAASLTAQEVSTTVAQAMASATPAPAYSASVFQIIQPSIVLIQTESSNADGDDSFGLGTGVVIDANGSILTSLHVVNDARSIELTFADGTKSGAQIATEQPENDIAVLTPDQLPPQLVPATLGNPRAMHIGDEAYVVGHPLGLYSSMSAGVISGFDRSFQPINSEQRIEGLIQIDAAVNPGNSGGPLLNRSGQVVGIVTGLVNPTKQDVFIGIGFAVPITTAAGAAGLPQY